jgi:GTP pyrophosphokinase
MSTLTKPKRLPTVRQQLPVKAASQLAKELYGDAKHPLGISYVEHIETVLALLTPFALDDTMKTVCALQHVLSLRLLTLTELEERYGTEVRSLVSGLHLLSRVTSDRRRVSIEDLRLMLISVTEDARVIPLVLADRIVVLEHSSKLLPVERRRIARDVLTLFAPVAARLGIHALKQRLEQLAFPLVYASDAETIAEQQLAVTDQHGDFLAQAIKELKSVLKTLRIEAKVDARIKQPYSVFSKMKAKGYTHISQLPDLFAIRVIVENTESCYQVLGVLHSLGRPAGNRFKDYIAFPKPNGYRSLHTTMSRFPGIPEGMFLEVQIRTTEMHREAEYGIAAHWSYKEGGLMERAAARARVQQALTTQFLDDETGKAPVLSDHIFVLTPRGDVIELPEGATALDFAFQVHTQLGLSFRAARINGAIIPVDTELENGDTVEILTQKTPKPSPEWLQHLKLASSRSRLKHFLAEHHHDALLALGRTMVNAELKQRGLPQLDRDLSLLKNVDGRLLSTVEREDLLIKIGQGSDKVSPLLRRIGALGSTPALTPKVRLQRKDSVIEVDGGVPMPIRYAKCCKPQENQSLPIVGIIGRGGEVMVHRNACKMLKKGNPERRVTVRWRK